MEGAEHRETIRLDKWLWAARFFKTRSVAAQAISGGKVQLHGTRAKPGREIRIGDELRIRRGPYEWIVVVRNLSPQRGPAREATLLYEETEESKRNRAAMAAQLRFERAGHLPPRGRPSKKARRGILRFTRRGR